MPAKLVRALCFERPSPALHALDTTHTALRAVPQHDDNMDGIKPPPKAGARVVEPSISVIVTLAPGSANAAWLSAWKEQLAGLEVLIVPAAGGSANVALPAGFEGAKVVAAPPAGVDGSKLSGREIALLTAKGPRVLFLAEGSTPATTPKGEVVQLVKEHTYNLSTPATPFFFNTLYDPFRTGADFVRGYPFSLRDGVKTAVSHGLALGGTVRFRPAPPRERGAVAPPTSPFRSQRAALPAVLQSDLLSPLPAGPWPRGTPGREIALRGPATERTAACSCARMQARYVDATLTLPKQAWAVLSPSNLAIDKCASPAAAHTGRVPAKRVTRNHHTTCDHMVVQFAGRCWALPATTAWTPPASRWTRRRTTRGPASPSRQAHLAVHWDGVGGGGRIGVHECAGRLKSSRFPPATLGAQALANHLGYGVKTGLPYVASSSKAAAEDKTLPSARFEVRAL